MNQRNSNKPSQQRPPPRNHSHSTKMLPHNFKVGPPPPPPVEEKLYLSNFDLNVSAGGTIYECAKSRRQRHRKALMSSNMHDAIPLGKSGKCGPNRTSDVPGDILNDKIGGDIRGNEKEKVEELMNHGRAAAARAVKRSKTTCRMISSGKGAGGMFHRKPDNKLVRKMGEIERDCRKRPRTAESKYTLTAAHVAMKKEAMAAHLPVKKEETFSIPRKPIHSKRKLSARAEKIDNVASKSEDHAHCRAKKEDTDVKITSRIKNEVLDLTTTPLPVKREEEAHLRHHNICDSRYNQHTTFEKKVNSLLKKEDTTVRASSHTHAKGEVAHPQHRYVCNSRNKHDTTSEKKTHSRVKKENTTARAPLLKVKREDDASLRPRKVHNSNSRNNLDTQSRKPVQCRVKKEETNVRTHNPNNKLASQPKGANSVRSGKPAQCRVKNEDTSVKTHGVENKVLPPPRRAPVRPAAAPRDGIRRRLANQFWQPQLRL